MNLSIISNYPQLLKRLTQHIGYLGDKCYQINNKQFSVTEKPKTLMIISRKHYQESWTTYSAVSLLELKKILRLQKAQNKESRCIQQYYSNNEADGFDVKTITFSSNINNSLPDKVVLIPETELLTATNTEKVVHDVQTPQGKLFCAKSNNKVLSAYESKLLKSNQSFMLSVGYSSESKIISFSQEEYAEHLLTALFTIELANLIKIIAIKLDIITHPLQFHKLYWGPVLTALLFVLIGNGYFYLKNESINSQLASYDEAVNELLLMQTKQEQSTAFIDIAQNELKRIKPQLEAWEIVYNAVSSGMHVQQFRKSDKQYMLRGKATDASEILAVMNKLPMVKNASFDGAVRKVRNTDSFIIRFELEEKT